MGGFGGLLCSFLCTSKFSGVIKKSSILHLEFGNTPHCPVNVLEGELWSNDKSCLRVTYKL